MQETRQSVYVNWRYSAPFRPLYIYTIPTMYGTSEISYYLRKLGDFTSQELNKREILKGKAKGAERGSNYNPTYANIHFLPSVSCRPHPSIQSSLP